MPDVDKQNMKIDMEKVEKEMKSISSAALYNNLKWWANGEHDVHEETLKKALGILDDIIFCKFKDDFLIKLSAGEIFYRARTINIDDYGNVEKGIHYSSDRLFGYNWKESKEPPVKYAAAGRNSQAKEKALYLASNEITACVEVRPPIRALISIAKFVLNSDITIIDFSKLNYQNSLDKMDKIYNIDMDYDNYSIDTVSDEHFERLKGGMNVLLYGVPGCGKSYTLKMKYCKDADAVERVVFHPDYTYGDFVGQILPLTDANTGKIKYEFSPGPFTRILSDAYNNPSKKYCLIIEEINRGNAPAIFGDIFQLLDRDEDGSGTYEITNVDIANKVYINGSKIKKIKLPSNLFIYATMNTSDQNVFTLDTAFQRRWNMRMVENNIFKSKYANSTILDTSIKWSKFNQIINDLILSKNIGMTSSEYKRLGAYFVTENDLHFFTTNDGISQEEADEKNRNFAEKVLKYLWDDAFKFSRDEVFKNNYDSLEKIIKAFVAEKGDKRFNIFMDDIFGLNLDD